MLMGLKEGQEKMSKSDPDSAIFMEDTDADVKRKVRQSYCPPGVVEGNPCLDWTKHIVFGRNGSFSVARKPDDGGDMCVVSWDARARARVPRRACVRGADGCRVSALAHTRITPAMSRAHPQYVRDVRGVGSGLRARRAAPRRPQGGADGG